MAVASDLAVWRSRAELARRFRRGMAFVGMGGVAAIAAGETVTLSGGAVLAAQIAVASIVLMPVVHIGVAALAMRKRLESTMIIGEDGRALSVVRSDLPRALDEELGRLERTWREAEEIAAIADDLLVPESTRRFIDFNKANS